MGEAVARSAEPRGDDSSCGAGGKEAEDKWTRGPGSMVSTAFLQASPAPLPQEYGGACGKGVRELGKAQAEHTCDLASPLTGGDKCQAWDKAIIALGWQRRNGSFCAIGAEGCAEEDGGARDGGGEQAWLPSSRAAPSWRGQQKVLTRGGGCGEWDGVKGNRHGVLCARGDLAILTVPLSAGGGERQRPSAGRSSQRPSCRTSVRQ